MDHQFSEDEAREVFARAAERQHAVGTKGEGLSLDELRAIGREAGLDPEHVEAAARAVLSGEPETGRVAIGPLPRGVFRTEILPGPPADALWEQLVADARRTFSAQGKLSEVGRIREWRNGNLRISLEPLGDGTSRLHFQTRRAERTQLAIAAAVVGVFAFLSAIAGSVDLLANGGLWGVVLLGLGMMLGSLGIGYDQRRWADERERQFAEIAQRATEAGPLSSGGAVPSADARIDSALLDALLDPDASDRPSSHPRTRS